MNNVGRSDMLITSESFKGQIMLPFGTDGLGDVEWSLPEESVTTTKYLKLVTTV